MAIITLNNRSINRSDTASADQVWTATSATASDFQAAGGKVLQVVQSSLTSQASTTTSTSFVASGLNVSITPSATSSKILVRYDLNHYSVTGNCNTTVTLYRSSTNLGDADNGMGWGYVNSNHGYPLGASYLDSPSTTSSTTYEVYIKTNGGTIYIGAGQSRDTHNFITAMEIGA